MLRFKKKEKNEIPKSGPVIFHSPCDIDDDVYLVEYNKTLVGINIDCCIKHLKVSSLRLENEGVEWNKRRVLNIVCTEVPGGKSFWFTPSNFGTKLFHSEEEAKDKLKYILTKEVIEK